MMATLGFFCPHHHYRGTLAQSGGQAGFVLNDFSLQRPANKLQEIQYNQIPYLINV